MPETDAIVCEIHTPHAAQAGVLAEATAMVARSIGQSVIVKTLAIGKGSQDALLTLHLPAALVGTQHRVWCMACQLTCFCPHARVSVLVRGVGAFRQRSAGNRRKRRAA